MRKGLAAAVFCGMALLCHADAVYKVQNFVANMIHPDLFSQFLEHPTFSKETGVEAVLPPGKNKPPEALIKMIRDMQIPVLRYPGGTGVDYDDWTDLIDLTPGRSGKRPDTIGFNGTKAANRFGLHEYFALRDQIGCQTILVCNFLDALTGKKSVNAAAEHAAALVAYANLPAGTDNPYNLWADFRAKNGSAKPFHAEYIQIGNEWSVFASKVAAVLSGKEKKTAAARYIAALHEYIKAIRIADPNIKIIIDAEMGFEHMRYEVLSDPLIRKEVKYAAIHIYAPMSHLNRVTEQGEPIAPGKLSRADFFRIFAPMPGEYNAKGVCAGLGERVELAHKLGYTVVCTEWNWNGWGMDELENGKFSPVIPGLGAAAFIHGLFQQGDSVKLAAQSILIGHEWGINTIRVSPGNTHKPYFRPQGMAYWFYKKYHGNSRLAIETAGEEEYYGYPYRAGGHRTAGRIAYLDVTATASEDKVFLHIVNRDGENPRKVRFDLAKLNLKGQKARLHVYRERTPSPDNPEETEIVSKEIILTTPDFALAVDPASASIVELSR